MKGKHPSCLPMALDATSICGDTLHRSLNNSINWYFSITSVPGGTIELRTQVDGSFVKIHVRDSGIGIPADMLEQIFHPFEQIQQKQDENNDSGFGLGLPISKKLSQKMGGDLTVSSTHGEGTVFTLHVPLAEEESYD